MSEVTAYIQNLAPALNKLVQAVRALILGTDSAIGEHIKWNSPAFYYTGEMAAFDAKEYKRDLVVMNLQRGHVLLVFPTGARIKNGRNILEGKYSDGRRLVKITSLEELQQKSEALQAVISDWLAGVEQSNNKTA